MSNYKWFDDTEIVGLDKELCAGLDMAREECGFPFHITSGFRTLAKNFGLSGAVGNSSHLTGHAVDLEVNDDFTLERMVSALMHSGFNRFGIYCSFEGLKLTPTHLHVDNDKTKPAHVMWLQIEQN